MRKLNENRGEFTEEELGTMNPLYVESILEKDTVALLLWMEEKLKDLGPTVHETVRHAERERDAGGTYDKGPLRLGFKMLESDFRLLSLIVKEMQSRLKAIDVHGGDASTAKQLSSRS